MDRSDLTIRVEVGPLDEPLRVVPEEQVAPVIGREHLAAVHRATGDGRAFAGMRIGVDRVDVAIAARGAHAFMQRPAVVSALDDVVDLLPAKVAHVAAIELASGAVELEAPGIAESIGPDRPQLAGLAGERIVSRDRTVLVDPQDFPVRIAQVLGIRPVAVIADCEVQLAVGSKPDAPADVEQLRRRRGPEQLVRAVGTDVVGRTEPDQVVQQIMPGVIEVDVMIGLAEFGIERDADQPTVPGVLRRQISEGGRQQLPVLDDLDLSSSLQDEDSAVRCDLESPRGRSGHHL